MACRFSQNSGLCAPWSPPSDSRRSRRCSDPSHLSATQNRPATDHFTPARRPSRSRFSASSRTRHGSRASRPQACRSARSRTVQREDRSRSGSCAVVEVEHPTETLAPMHWLSWRDDRGGPQELICEAWRQSRNSADRCSRSGSEHHRDGYIATACCRALLTTVDML